MPITRAPQPPIITRYEAAAISRRLTAVGGALLVATLTIAVMAANLDAAVLDVARSALNGEAKAPTNAGVIEKGFATVQGNWYWFLLVTLPLAAGVLFGAVALGVRSASDWLFRLVVGFIGVIALAPALVA